MEQRQISNLLPRKKTLPKFAMESFFLFLNPQNRTQQVDGIAAREGTKTRDLFLLQKKPKRGGEKKHRIGEKKSQSSKYWLHFHSKS